MDKKMFAVVMVALFVAVCFATNGFAANVSATADENPATVDDTPTIVFAREGLEVTGETMINGTPVRELTITVLNETTLEFDEESKSFSIDGGYLVIDECASDKCVAKAYSGTLSGMCRKVAQTPEPYMTHVDLITAQVVLCLPRLPHIRDKRIDSRYRACETTVAVLATLGTYLPERDTLRAITALFYFLLKICFHKSIKIIIPKTIY
jgi:hypothetical protein